MNFPRKFSPLALLMLVLTSACSSVQNASQYSAAVPNAQLATVYLYRTHDSPGVGVDVKDNGIDIGTLQDGTYFVYHAVPGQHVFTVTTDTTATQNINLQGGATYYVKAGVVSSQHLFHPSLSVVFDLQGQSAVQNLRRLNYQE